MSVIVAASSGRCRGYIDLGDVSLCGFQKVPESARILLGASIRWRCCGNIGYGFLRQLTFIGAVAVALMVGCLVVCAIS